MEFWRNILNASLMVDFILVALDVMVTAKQRLRPIPTIRGTEVVFKLSLCQGTVTLSLRRVCS